MTCCTLLDAKMAKPVWRTPITSLWSPKMLSAWVARARAATWNTAGVCSAASLYMFGIISSRPCDAVNVLVYAPAETEPWTAPAAPPSDCISTMETRSPKMFLLPCAPHSSMLSAIGEEGVIG